MTLLTLYSPSPKLLKWFKNELGELDTDEISLRISRLEDKIPLEDDDNTSTGKNCMVRCVGIKIGLSEAFSSFTSMSGNQYNKLTCEEKDFYIKVRHGIKRPTLEYVE
jgi:hypothetical protein